jgi:hypothetical protein
MKGTLLACFLALGVTCGHGQSAGDGTVGATPESVAQPGDSNSPQPVSSNYPGLTQVSSFLATKFETDNLVKGSQQATDMILVAALAEATTADVVSQREAQMPFGGFELPVQDEHYEHGNLYILCGLVEQKSSSFAVSKIDPWPMWQLVCGKLFRTDKSKIYSIRYVSPERMEVPLLAKSVQDVASAAVDGLNELPEYKAKGAVHRLASVISVERQTVDEKYFKELALAEIPNDVQIYYVYFLTSDTQDDIAPANVHACAVLRTPTQLKMVRQISLGQPGYTILQATAQIEGLTVFNFDQDKQDAFKSGTAKAIGAGLSDQDVQITGIDVLHGGDSSSSGVKVVFTMSVLGGGDDIQETLADDGFVQSLADNLQAVGLKTATSDQMQFQSQVLIRNEALYDDGGLSLLQILTIISSFVLGVLVTTVVGVMGLRKNNIAVESAEN